MCDAERGPQIECHLAIRDPLAWQPNYDRSDARRYDQRHAGRAEEGCVDASAVAVRFLAPSE